MKYTKLPVKDYYPAKVAVSWFPHKVGKVKRTSITFRLMLPDFSDNLPSNEYRMYPVADLLQSSPIESYFLAPFQCTSLSECWCYRWWEALPGQKSVVNKYAPIEKQFTKSVHLLQQNSSSQLFPLRLLISST